MSFGNATSRRGRRPAPAAPCPCGGGAAFEGCCGPVLTGIPAASAEALMRSRFTAFALGDAVHLEQTWHPSTAPERVDLDDAQRWERLEITRTEQGDRRGVVEFRAHWRDANTGRSGILHEVSRFRRVGDRWYYLDGDVS